MFWQVHNELSVEIIHQMQLSFCYIISKGITLQTIKIWGFLKSFYTTKTKRMRWLESITDSMDMNLNRLGEIVEDRGARHAAEHGVEKSET